MKVHRGTLCPTFEETRSFHVSRGWMARGLGRAAGDAHTPPHRSPPWSCPGPPRGCRCPSQHEPLGVLSLPLGTVDLQPTSPGALAPSGPPQRCRGVPADHWAPVPPCPVCPAGKLRPFLLPAA